MAQQATEPVTDQPTPKKSPYKAYLKDYCTEPFPIGDQILTASKTGIFDYLSFHVTPIYHEHFLPKALFQLGPQVLIQPKKKATFQVTKVIRFQAMLFGYLQSLSLNL